MISRIFNNLKHYRGKLVAFYVIVSMSILILNDAQHNLKVSSVFRQRRIETFDVLHRQTKGLQRRLPNCLIIGVRKGGTLALLTYLGLHPDIVAAENELHFFTNTKRYEEGYSAYKKRLPTSYEDQIIVEKTPEYFIHELTPSRVYKMNSSIKLLLTVRNPVSRLLSDYAMKESKARKEHKQYPLLNKLVLDKSGNVNASARSIVYSSYYDHMKRWMDYFPRSQFHIVNGENLVLKPFEEISKIETFLNIRHEVTEDVFVYNETKGFYCYRSVEDKSVCLPPTKGREHPKVNAKLLKKLQAYFKKENEKFFTLIGETFEW